MTTEQYNRLIDGSIEAFSIFLHYICWYICIFVASSLIIALVNDFLLSEPISFLFITLLSSVILAFPPTIIYFYNKKAKRLYEDYSSNTKLKLRDFWMGFGKYIEIANEKHDPDEADKWINKNIKHMHKRLSKRTYVFASTADAVAFKLQFEGD